MFTEHRDGRQGQLMMNCLHHLQNNRSGFLGFINHSEKNITSVLG